MDKQDLVIYGVLIVLGSVVLCDVYAAMGWRYALQILLVTLAAVTVSLILVYILELIAIL
jgi:hypothetical protein